MDFQEFARFSLVTCILAILTNSKIYWISTLLLFKSNPISTRLGSLRGSNPENGMKGQRNSGQSCNMNEMQAQNCLSICTHATHLHMSWTLVNIHTYSTHNTVLYPCPSSLDAIMLASLFLSSSLILLVRDMQRTPSKETNKRDLQKQIHVSRWNGHRYLQGGSN